MSMSIVWVYIEEAINFFFTFWNVLSAGLPTQPCVCDGERAVWGPYLCHWATCHSWLSGWDSSPCLSHEVLHREDTLGPQHWKLHGQVHVANSEVGTSAVFCMNSQIYYFSNFLLFLLGQFSVAIWSVMVGWLLCNIFISDDVNSCFQAFFSDSHMWYPWCRWKHASDCEF